MIPKLIPKKYRPAIDHWDDERHIGNGIIITLKSGYYWSHDSHGLHVMGFDTVQEAIENLPAIEKCDCSLCV